VRKVFRLPAWVWLLTAALLVRGAFSENPVLTPFAAVLLPVFAALLWRADEPPVLVFACAMQWLQAAAGILYANTFSATLSELFNGPELERATWLSLVGVAVNALGMKVMLFHLPSSAANPSRIRGSQINVANAFIFYLGCFVVATIAERFAFALPSLAQPIYAVASLKWVAIFVLFYSVIQQRSGYGLLGIAVMIEFGIGLLGYFSSFKSVFFVLLVTALTSAGLRRKQLVTTVAIAAILFTTGIVWSAIKQDYREFLNKGTEQQQVLVPMEERAVKLGELVANVSWESFTNGLESMVLRVSQVSLFAYTIMNVPDSIPYARGALWLDAVKRVVTPRVLFPDKAVVDDSERTNLYTGIGVAGTAQGTSIGIGYMAESYVDFGPMFMFVPIFFLGMFYGFIYRLFVFARHRVLGYGVATAILTFGACSIDTSNIKVVGGNLAVLLVLGTLYLAFGRAFIEWLTLGDDALRVEGHSVR
jgi:hypothetical protein